VIAGLKALAGDEGMKEEKIIHVESEGEKGGIRGGERGVTGLSKIGPGKKRASELKFEKLKVQKKESQNIKVSPYEKACSKGREQGRRAQQEGRAEKTSRPRIQGSKLKNEMQAKRDKRRPESIAEKMGRDEVAITMKDRDGTGMCGSAED